MVPRESCRHVGKGPHHPLWVWLRRGPASDGTPDLMIFCTGHGEGLLPLRDAGGPAVHVPPVKHTASEQGPSDLSGAYLRSGIRVSSNSRRGGGCIKALKKIAIR